MIEGSGSRSDTRSRIVDVAARLLQEEGSAAVTTRGVAEAAGVQAPAIYRLFGDKDGLLEAVAEYVMATYVSEKRRPWKLLRQPMSIRWTNCGPAGKRKWISASPIQRYFIF